MKVVLQSSTSARIRRGRLAPKPDTATKVAQKLSTQLGTRTSTRKLSTLATSPSFQPQSSCTLTTTAITPGHSLPFFEAQCGGDNKETVVDKLESRDWTPPTIAFTTPPPTPRSPEPQPEEPIPDSGTMQAADGQQQPAIAHTTASALPLTTTESVGKDVAPFLTKHIPERYTAAPPQDDSQPGSTNYCYRHRPDVKCRRQADEITMDSLQKVGHFPKNIPLPYSKIPPNFPQSVGLSHRVIKTLILATPQVLISLLIFVSSFCDAKCDVEARNPT